MALHSELMTSMNRTNRAITAAAPKIGIQGKKPTTRYRMQKARNMLVESAGMGTPPWLTA